MNTYKLMKTPKTRQLGYRVFPEVLAEFSRAVDTLSGHVRGPQGGDPSEANITEMFLVWFSTLTTERRIEVCREMRSAYWRWTEQAERRGEGRKGGGDDPPPAQHQHQPGGSKVTGSVLPIKFKEPLDGSEGGGGGGPKKGGGIEKKDKGTGGKPPRG